MDPVVSLCALSEGALSARESVLAGDVANAATPGFQPEDLSFGGTVASLLSPQAVVQPGFETPDGNGVDVEAVLARLESVSVAVQAVGAVAQSRLAAAQQAASAVEGA